VLDKIAIGWNINENEKWTCEKPSDIPNSITGVIPRLDGDNFNAIGQ
jgi:hypothetical protein